MKTLLFLLIFTFPYNITAQIETSNNVKVSDNVYNKQTGQKLTEKEIFNLYEQYPKIVLERVYNKYGVLEKLLFDPNNIINGKAIFRNEENQIKPNELFPEFVFKTVTGKKIISEELKGSWVLLRFELLAKMINRGEIISLEKQITEFKLSDKLTAVILFADDTNVNIKETFNTISSNFELIAEGRNFQERYNIIKFPTTILIDKNGIVYKYYFGTEKIDFNDLK